MIIDPRVFKDVYLPRELVHRESEVGQISRTFQPALSGSTPHNALIGGTIGVGKKVLARHTVDRPEKRAPVSHAHIRCLGKSTGAILREALRQHPADVSDQVSKNTPVDDIYQFLGHVTHYFRGIFSKEKVIHPIRLDRHSFSQTTDSQNVTFNLGESTRLTITTIPANMTVELMETGRSAVSVESSSSTRGSCRR